jgi:glycosyltransferase involved in cell wall biosynthesis
MMMGDDKSSPGKIFEYIGAKKTILACLPQGMMRSTIEEAGGICVEPRDVAKIAEAIVSLYEQYERRQLRGPRPEIIDKYNRITLAGEVAKTLSALTD